jgi:putative membrane protein
MRRWLPLPGLGLAGTASAHAREAAGPLLEWTWDAWVTVPLLLSAAWFALGFVRLWRRAPHPQAYRNRGILFGAGWLLLAAALVSPLHSAGERSFAAHMLEHEILMLAAAPLLVLARPVAVALWALPARARLALGRLHQHRGFAGLWRAASGAWIATLLQAAALWLWHLPALFDRALAAQGWHVAQHVSFVVTALLFWTAVTRRGVLHGGAAILCLFATAAVSGALGALMALSGSPWYAAYAALDMKPFGLSPSQDQQLAGVLMWVPGGLVHLFAASMLLARLLRESAAEVRDALD